MGRVETPSVHFSQPKTVTWGEIMARAACTLTLHERLTAEVLQTASCWCQGLSPTLVPWSCMLEHRDVMPSDQITLFYMFFIYILFMYPPYHNEWISRPEISPFGWTLWCRQVLTVHCNSWWWSFTHHTSADMRSYFQPLQRLRGTGGRGGQPEGFVVATCISARFHITTGERHCAENSHTWTRLAWGTHTKYLCKLMFV